jgi:hypothetical protein
VLLKAHSVNTLYVLGGRVLYVSLHRITVFKKSEYQVRKCIWAYTISQNKGVSSLGKLKCTIVQISK